MLQHDIFAVVRSAGALVDISNCSVARRHHGINWLASLVALDAANVQTFVHLIAFAAHAAERATLPRFARGADKILFFAVLFEQSTIGRGQLKRLAQGGARGANSQSPKNPSKVSG